MTEIRGKEEGLELWKKTQRTSKKEKQGQANYSQELQGTVKLGLQILILFVVENSIGYSDN